MLTNITDDFLKRDRYCIDHRLENNIVINDKKLVNFSSNDYLNLATHPEIKKAFINGIHQYGTGSTASVIVSGYFKPHAELEEKFAAFVKRDRALLFNSGYHANLGVITTLANRNSSIIADKLAHASLIDGIRLSRAQHHRYAHQSLPQLTKLLTQEALHKIVITESVFSMEGNISPIDQIAALCAAHQAYLIVDDAHGIGILGDGEGVAHHYQLDQIQLPCMITPLGKAFAGMGAIVTGTHDLIETLIQTARTYHYTTALPPAVASAAIATLHVIETENWRREKLQANIRYFLKIALAFGLTLTSHDLTPIKSILIGDNAQALKIKDHLMQQGFFISCIRPPTVPAHTARLRITLNALHSEKEIHHLLSLIANAHANVNL